MEEKFEVLKGKVLTSIIGKKNDEEMIFVTSDGEKFKLFHDQDCCEFVSIEDIIGDLDDLLDSPIIEAEEAVGGEPVGWKRDEYEDSYTWTFYKLATAKGFVTIRWFGSSNGYYSEYVNFERVR